MPKKNNKKNGFYSNNIICVEKIDTTTTTQKESKNIKELHNTKNTHYTKNTEYTKNTYKKNENPVKNNKDNNLKDSIDLVLDDVSKDEYIDKNIITHDDLLLSSENNDTIHKLYLKKNILEDLSVYQRANRLVKKNRNKISDTLYEHKIIKNKAIPHKLLFHIYFNFLNDDIEVEFT